MRKIVAFYIVIVLLNIMSASANVFTERKNVNIQSTQGVEITESEAQLKSKIKSDASQDKQKKKNRAKLLRNVHKIEKYENSKRLKNRDKEFLETRLNRKKMLLEELKKENLSQEKGTTEENNTVEEKGE